MYEESKTAVQKTNLERVVEATTANNETIVQIIERLEGIDIKLDGAKPTDESYCEVVEHTGLLNVELSKLCDQEELLIRTMELISRIERLV